MTVGAKVNLGKPDYARWKEGKKGASGEAPSERTSGTPGSTLPLRAVLHDFPTRRLVVSATRIETLPFRRKLFLRLRQLVARSKASSNSKLGKIGEANLELHRDEMYKEDAIEFTNISKRRSLSIF